MLRDHCRKMAAAPDVVQRPKGISGACRPPAALKLDEDHDGCPWGWQGCACPHHDADRPQPPTDSERALWTHLADEIDTWLTNGLEEIDPETHTTPLWENA